jgi:hypothetical protein
VSTFFQPLPTLEPDEPKKVDVSVKIDYKSSRSNEGFGRLLPKEGNEVFDAVHDVITTTTNRPSQEIADIIKAELMRKANADQE